MAVVKEDGSFLTPSTYVLVSLFRLFLPGFKNGSVHWKRLHYPVLLLLHLLASLEEIPLTYKVENGTARKLEMAINLVSLLDTHGSPCCLVNSPYLFLLRTSVFLPGPFSLARVTSINNSCFLLFLPFLLSRRPNLLRENMWFHSRRLLSLIASPEHGGPRLAENGWCSHPHIYILATYPFSFLFYPLWIMQLLNLYNVAFEKPEFCPLVRISRRDLSNEPLSVSNTMASC